jgi:hypothetical protein
MTHPDHGGTPPPAQTDVLDVTTLARVEDAITLVRIELLYALAGAGPMRSPDEGAAMIRRAHDGMWDEVRIGDGEGEAPREVVTLAAMALRYLIDLGPTDLRGWNPWGRA